MNLTGLRQHQRPWGGQLDSAPNEEADDDDADDDGNEGRKPANGGRDEVKSFEPSSSLRPAVGLWANFLGWAVSRATAACSLVKVELDDRRSCLANEMIFSKNVKKPQHHARLLRAVCSRI